MTQLADDSAAVGGDPVEQTDATEQAAPVETAATLEDLYPNEASREPDTDPQPEPEPEEQDPSVNDEAEAEPDGEEEGDPEQDDEPEQPAIERPKSWKADAEEEWSALPRNIQERIAERETERERFVNTKAQEAAQTENRVRQMAEQELAQFSEQQAMQYQMLAKQFFPQQPDRNLLFTGNPQDQLKYQQQQALYEDGLAQQQQLQQAAAEHAQRAQRIRDDQDNAARQQDAERLRAEMPEWFDEAKQADLQSNLTATAKALGYPDELLPEANASDLLALRTAHEWKDKAAKWDAYQKAKMQPVRAAKKKAPIPNTPGSPMKGQQSADPIAMLYPDDVRR